MYTAAAKLAYKGVLIERPCAHCDTVNHHYDNLCQEGPCAQCGVDRRVDGITTHWSTDHDWQAHTYEPADFSVPSLAFDEMLAAVKAHGMPSSYTSDLFRDYQNLTGTGRIYKERMEDERFIWVVRPMGTHMFRPDEYGRAGLRYHIDNTPDAHYYLWGGAARGLMHVRNGDTAAAILAMPPLSYRRAA